jgi:hypothetical protein
MEKQALVRLSRTDFGGTERRINPPCILYASSDWVLMGMRAEVLAGVAVLACVPIALVVASFMGVLPSLSEAVGQVIIAVIPAMIVGGASLIWFGRKPDEQELSRKRDIHAAIKEWVESFPNVYNPYPLAAKPPELSVEIENCLSRKYPSIWVDVERLRDKYSELLQIESGNFPDEFYQDVNGRRTLYMEAVEGRKLSMKDQLAAMERQLREEIGREIVERHFIRLKC